MLSSAWSRRGIAAPLLSRMLSWPLTSLIPVYPSEPLTIVYQASARQKGPATYPNMSELHLFTRGAKHPRALRNLLHHNENSHDERLLEDEEPGSLVNPSCQPSCPHQIATQANQHYTCPTSPPCPKSSLAPPHRDGSTHTAGRRSRRGRKPRTNLSAGPGKRPATGGRRRGRRGLRRRGS